MTNTQRFGWMSLFTVLFVVGLTGRLVAQLPPGWQDLSAVQFLEAANGALDTEQQAVAAHAWGQLLSDPAFISDGDWPVVQEMILRYASRDDVPGVGTEAKAQLKTRVDARIAADPTFVTGKGLFELHWAVKALQATGSTDADRASMFVEWMQTNEWRSLAIHNLYNLYEWINLDSLDQRHFSVRWTGTLMAPATRDYTIRQLRQYRGGDSQLKVTINGAVVLDTTGVSPDDSRFTSAPIQLAAGVAVPIQVEMVHDVDDINLFSAGAPMAVLTWQANGLPEAIIPSSAFRPPAQFAEPEAQGLKGEYFGNTQFGDLRVTRLDPALDLICSWPPVASVQQQAASEVFHACKAKLLDDAFLAQSVAEGKPKVFSYNMWRIAYRMTASDRLLLVQKLRRNPEVLAIMTPEAMGRLAQAIYMLPGQEYLELLGEWALARPQPRCVAGPFPGWGYGYYQEQNTDYYWLMGHFLQGPYRNDAETLRELYLIRPNGECNLPVAYVAAFAARANGTGKEPLLAKLNEQIDDESLSGDQRMTWYVAKAFAQGALRGRLTPLAGLTDLESAYMVADSNDYKFWALQEMVARLSSLGYRDRAQALVEEHQGRFTAPSQQAAMAEWRAKADELANRYAALQESQVRAAANSYLAELRQRMEQATTRGDAAAQQRLTALIGQVEAAQSAE